MNIFQKGLYNVLSALAKEGYADIHAEGNTKKMSAAESKEHLEQYKDYLNVIIKMFEAFKKAYLEYLAHYNLLRKKFKEYKANKTPEKKEALKLLHSRLENLRSILLKFIPKIKSTKITAESSEQELRKEAVKIIEKLDEAKDFMKKNNDLFYYYSGAAMRLDFEGKIRRIPCEDANLLKELENSVLSGNQREVARIHVEREIFSLRVMVRDMDSSGKRVAIIVFGGSHSWKKYVDFLNKKHPNRKIALLEATPKGFEEYMKKTKETQKKLDKAIKKLEETSKLADEALEKANKIPKSEKTDIDRALELEMKNQ
jgi:hypothetical protein